MARKNNMVLEWRTACRLSQQEAARLLNMSAQRYGYFERKAKVMPKDALRIMASVWAEATERDSLDFYKSYHAGE